jgi:hypothetical protein
MAKNGNKKTGRLSPEDQVASVKKAIPRVWTIDPTTKVVPNKKRPKRRSKHRVAWENA